MPNDFMTEYLFNFWTVNLFSHPVSLSIPVGPVVYTTSAQMIAPCVVVKGTLSITSAEMYFEVDEEDGSFKEADPTVGKSSSQIINVVIIFSHHLVA